MKFGAIFSTKKFWIITVIVVIAIVAIVLGVVLSQQSSGNDNDGEELRFPDDFRFGAASAAYQVEGGWNADGKGPSIWDHLTHNRPDQIADQSTGDVSANSYELYREDVRALKDAGLNFYRFSISWSRILADGDISSLNEAGITYYNNLINELIANDIEPMVTMYHWDLPQTLQDIGGWANPLIVDYFVEYARILLSRFGDRIKLWATFNEPYIMCELGYGGRLLAPMVNANGIGDYLCGHHVLLSHAKVYRLYKSSFQSTPGKMGIVLNSEHSWPTNSTISSHVEAAERTMEFLLGWFANPIFSVNGDYPADMIQRIAANSALEGRPYSRLPIFTAAERNELRGSADFLGLNMYTSNYAEPTPDISWAPNPSFFRDQFVHTYQNESWPVAALSWLRSIPEGLRAHLNYIHNKYNAPEVIITENGWSDVGQLTDTGRIDYLKGHLKAVLEAIVIDGCRVTGHTTWSIIDNFEWTQGYTQKFGLYHIDFTNPNRPRTPKASVAVLREIVESRIVSE